VNEERNAPALAEFPAEVRPSVGIPTQSMMNVDRGDAAVPKLVKKDDRIDAAGKADRDSLSARSLP
jgi:hypothetical protein